jgi:hypothetical protein
VIYPGQPKRRRHEPPMEEPPGLGAKFDLAREWIGKSEVWPEIKTYI